MNVVDVHNLTHRYGKRTVLHDLELEVPEGSLYALLGPNGSGKTTLLQILMGLRRMQSGRVSLLGKAISAHTLADRTRIGYVAEAQSLPGWMTIRQLENYLAPLYPQWDATLATSLRTRFELDPGRQIKTFSRGEYMKAALLCALAPRPTLLIMDEPFTGMDALVKDDLVRGLLDSSGSEGWTVLLCSHDIGELELLADWVGFLGNGRMQVSEPLESVQRRFKRVDITGTGEYSNRNLLSPEWLSVERSGRRLSFIAPNADDAFVAVLPARFPGAERIEVRDAALREVFVALAKARPAKQLEEAAA